MNMSKRESDSTASTGRNDVESVSFMANLLQYSILQLRATLKTGLIRGTKEPDSFLDRFHHNVSTINDCVRDIVTTNSFLRENSQSTRTQLVSTRLAIDCQIAECAVLMAVVLMQNLRELNKISWTDRNLKTDLASQSEDDLDQNILCAVLALVELHSRWSPLTVQDNDTKPVTAHRSFSNSTPNSNYSAPMTTSFGRFSREPSFSGDTSSTPNSGYNHPALASKSPSTINDREIHSLASNLLLSYRLLQHCIIVWGNRRRDEHRGQAITGAAAGPFSEESVTVISTIYEALQRVREHSSGILNPTLRHSLQSICTASIEFLSTKMSHRLLSFPFEFSEQTYNNTIQRVFPQGFDASQLCLAMLFSSAPNQVQHLWNSLQSEIPHFWSYEGCLVEIRVRLPRKEQRKRRSTGFISRCEACLRIRTAVSTKLYPVAMDRLAVPPVVGEMHLFDRGKGRSKGTIKPPQQSCDRLSKWESGDNYDDALCWRHINSDGEDASYSSEEESTVLAAMRAFEEESSIFHDVPDEVDSVFFEQRSGVAIFDDVKGYQSHMLPLSSQTPSPSATTLLTLSSDSDESTADCTIENRSRESSDCSAGDGEKTFPNFQTVRVGEQVTGTSSMAIPPPNFPKFLRRLSFNDKLAIPVGFPPDSTHSRHHTQSSDPFGTGPRLLRRKSLPIKLEAVRDAKSLSSAGANASSSTMTTRNHSRRTTSAVSGWKGYGFSSFNVPNNLHTLPRWIGGDIVDDRRKTKAKARESSRVDKVSQQVGEPSPRLRASTVAKSLRDDEKKHRLELTHVSMGKTDKEFRLTRYLAELIIRDIFADGDRSIEQVGLSAAVVGYYESHWARYMHAGAVNGADIHSCGREEELAANIADNGSNRERISGMDRALRVLDQLPCASTHKIALIYRPSWSLSDNEVLMCDKPSNNFVQFALALGQLFHLNDLPYIGGMDSSHPYPDGEYALAVLRSTSITVLHTPVLMQPTPSNEALYQLFSMATAKQEDRGNSTYGEQISLGVSEMRVVDSIERTNICSEDNSSDSPVLPIPSRTLRRVSDLGMESPDRMSYCSCVTESLAADPTGEIEALTATAMFDQDSTRDNHESNLIGDNLLGTSNRNPSCGSSKAVSIPGSLQNPDPRAQLLPSTLSSTVGELYAVYSPMENMHLQSSNVSPFLSLSMNPQLIATPTRSPPVLGIKNIRPGDSHYITSPSPVSSTGSTPSGQTSLYTSSVMKLNARKRLVGNDSVHIVYADNELTEDGILSGNQICDDHLPSGPTKSEPVERWNWFNNNVCQVVIVAYRVGANHGPKGVSGGGNDTNSCNFHNGTMPNDTANPDKCHHHMVFVGLRSSAPSCMHYLRGFYEVGSLSECATLVRTLALLADEACQVSAAARSHINWDSPLRSGGVSLGGSVATWSPWARRQELLAQAFTKFS